MNPALIRFLIVFGILYSVYLIRLIRDFVDWRRINTKHKLLKSIPSYLSYREFTEGMYDAVGDAITIYAGGIGILYWILSPLATN